VAAAAPVEATPAPESNPASRALVATLNWVYGDKNAKVPDDFFTAPPQQSAAPEAPSGFDLQTAAMQPATPSSVVSTFATNVDLPGVKRVIEVRRGDTLFGLLTKAGLSDTEAQAASHSLTDVFSPSDLKVGQEITLNFATGAGPAVDPDNKLVALTLQPSVERDVKLTRAADGQFVAAAFDKPLTERVDRAAGQIDISLFEAARDAGVPVGPDRRDHQGLFLRRRFPARHPRRRFLRGDVRALRQRQGRLRQGGSPSLCLALDRRQADADLLLRARRRRRILHRRRCRGPEVAAEDADRRRAHHFRLRHARQPDPRLLGDAPRASTSARRAAPRSSPPATA
jgi:hypothetical protein